MLNSILPDQSAAENVENHFTKWEIRNATSSFDRNKIPVPSTLDHNVVRALFLEFPFLFLNMKNTLLQINNTRRLGSWASSFILERVRNWCDCPYLIGQSHFYQYWAKFTKKIIFIENLTVASGLQQINNKYLFPFLIKDGLFQQHVHRINKRDSLNYSCCQLSTSLRYTLECNLNDHFFPY